ILVQRAEWGMIIPLGFPVLPDVKMMNAACWGVTPVLFVTEKDDEQGDEHLVEEEALRPSIISGETMMRFLVRPLTLSFVAGVAIITVAPVCSMISFFRLCGWAGSSSTH